MCKKLNSNPHHCTHTHCHSLGYTSHRDYRVSPAPTASTGDVFLPGMVKHNNLKLPKNSRFNRINHHVNHKKEWIQISGSWQHLQLLNETRHQPHDFHTTAFLPLQRHHSSLVVMVWRAHYAYTHMTVTCAEAHMTGTFTGMRARVPISEMFTGIQWRAWL